MQQTDKLIRMANQIADFFDAMPDRTEAQEVSAAFRLQGRMPQYMVQVLR